MGKRDFVRRESKKPKKTAQKEVPTTILSPPSVAEVEVIKKGKKKEGEIEEEE